MRALVPLVAVAALWGAAGLHAACSGWSLGVCVGPRNVNASVCVSKEVADVRAPREDTLTTRAWVGVLADGGQELRRELLDAGR